MDFYYMPASAPCRSVLLTAKAVGVHLNKKELDLPKKEHLKPEFIAINPQHTIPTLVDGDCVVWESRAICTYLINKYGKDDHLYPKDPKTRATIERLLYFDMGTLYQRLADSIYPVYRGERNTIDPDKITKLQEALGFLDIFLKGKEFAAGNHVTVADFVLVATVSTIEALKIDLSSHSNVSTWLRRCKQKIAGYETENERSLKFYRDFAKDKLEK